MTRSVSFWSSVESDLFMAGLLRALGAEGFAVRQRFAISAGDYRRACGPLGRVKLRLRMYVEYPVRLAWAVFSAKRSDVHVVTTNPFFGPWIALLAARRGSKVIHLVYDLFPDALVVAGRFREDTATARLVRRLVRSTLDRATINVFLGDRLLRHAVTSFGPISKTFIIPVGTDATCFANNAPRPPDAGTKIDVLYCGNLGAMHDVDTLIAAIRSIEKRGGTRSATLTFHSSGPAYPSFKERACAVSEGVGTWLRLESSLSAREWVRRMSHAHVALVTMKVGAERVVMPSKTYSALAAGQAVLAVCPADSDLAELVVLRDCGWVIAPGDDDGLVSVLDEIVSRPDIVQRKRENAYLAGQLEYSEVAIAKLWKDLLLAAD